MRLKVSLDEAQNFSKSQEEVNVDQNFRIMTLKREVHDSIKKNEESLASLKKKIEDSVEILDDDGEARQKRNDKAIAELQERTQLSDDQVTDILDRLEAIERGGGNSAGLRAHGSSVALTLKAPIHEESRNLTQKGTVRDSVQSLTTTNAAIPVFEEIMPEAEPELEENSL